MVTLIIATSKTCLINGFGAAIVQDQTNNRSIEFWVFLTNMAVAIILFAAVQIGAPWISVYFDNSRLTALSRALSFLYLINAVGMVSSALLQKNMKFKKIAMINLIASVISGVIGVIAAVTGSGVWALVIQQVVFSAFQVGLTCLACPWFPSMKNLTHSRSGVVFGANVFVSRFIFNVFDNIYLVLIGKNFGEADLGFFTRAKRMQRLPADSITLAANHVLFPVFSKVSDDPMRLSAAAKHTLSSLALIVFPLMIGIAVCSHEIILLLLKKKWLPSVPLMHIFCLIGALYPINNINVAVLKSLKCGRTVLFINVVRNTLIIVSFFVAYRWGLEAVLWGAVAVSVFTLFTSSYFTQKHISYSVLQQLRDVSPYIVMSIGMGLLMLVTERLFQTSPVSGLIMKSVVGILFALAFCYAYQPLGYRNIQRMRQHLPIGRSRGNQ